jgi:hypothetical protein
MCWRSYEWRWEREPERASELAKTDHVRIADSDREQAISQLSKHAGDGRLTLEEFEARVAEVYAAKTYAELRRVFRDLPSNNELQPVRWPRSHTRRHVDVEKVMIPLLVLAFLGFLAATGHAWVLLIGLWVFLPRWGWGRSRRMHHRERDHTSDHMRDEDLTTV